MQDSIIAAASAIGGVLAGGVMQGAAARRDRRHRKQDALGDIVVELLAAVVGHREQQYLKVADRRDGVSDTRDARAERYAARSRMTAAMDRLTVTTSDRRLLAAAQEAVDAAVAVGDAPERNRQAAGDRARKAHTKLREVAARHLGTR